MNYAAVDKGVEMVEEAEVPARWADIEIPEEKIDENLPKWIRKIQMPVNAMKGDNIPVSDFNRSARRNHASGYFQVRKERYCS